MRTWFAAGEGIGIASLNSFPSLCTSAGAVEGVMMPKYSLTAIDLNMLIPSSCATMSDN